MIYTILVWACLSAEPTRCTTHERPMELSAMPTAAFKEAESWVAQWQADHPLWIVRGWRVEPGRGA